MIERGLCSTCVYDKGCTFPRKFPVLQCEEFSAEEPKSKKRPKAKPNKIKVA